MYECPNCGGALKFDIPSQQLKCDYCNTLLDPYTPLKAKNAVDVVAEPVSESTEQAGSAENQDINHKPDMAQAPYKRKMRPTYEATVFTCPQCGGEILSTDHEAAGFCSFCGSPTIFEKRIQQEECPEFIIPFQKTKADCKQEYAKLMKRAIFAPKELKDPQYIDGFRGIYMPYWAYMVTHKGNAGFSGVKKYRRGDYDYTDQYRLSGYVDAYYKGMSYDASSSFDDTISETIAPYDVRGMKTFTPAFLSGFYGDTADVDSKVYEEDAKKFANERTYEVASKLPAFSGYGFQNDAKKNQEFVSSSVLHTHCEEVNSTMFPVWFLSYRKGDRVAYATVNGQTGKVSADVPVDVKKYLLGALALTVPVFIILNIMLSMKATSLLILAAILAVVSIFLYREEMKKVIQRENHEEDKGLHSKTKAKKLNKKQAKTKRDIKINKEGSFISLMNFVGIGFYIIVLFPLATRLLSTFIKGNTIFIIVPVCIVGIIASIWAYRTWLDWEDRKKIPGFAGAAIAVLVATLIIICHPTSDIFYYAGTIISIVSVCFTILEMITTYNVLATRKLPQFNKTGGDDRA